MRALCVGLAFLAAALLAGCPDWDSFSRGNGAPAPDAGDSGTTSAVGDSGAEAAADAAEGGAVVPVVTVDFAVDPVATFDLTELGATDWLEAHSEEDPPNRCASCAPTITLLTTQDAPYYEYGMDGRTFRWSNGTPVAKGASNGGIFVEGIGRRFELEVAANGERQVLTVHVDTYFTGASFTAKLDGVTPASVDIPKAKDQQRYALRAHFTAAAGTKVSITFSETAVVPADATDVPNIAFSAATLAPEP